MCTAGATDTAAVVSGTAAGLEFIYSQRGRPLLVVDNYLFRKNRGSYWRCIRCTKNRCKCRLILRPGRDPVVVEQHSHGPETEKITFGRKVKTTMSTTPAAHDGNGDKVDEWRRLTTKQQQQRRERNGSGASIEDVLQVEPVQLWVRHPHFDTDEPHYVGMLDDAEEDGHDHESDPDVTVTRRSYVVNTTAVIE